VDYGVDSRMSLSSSSRSSGKGMVTDDSLPLITISIVRTISFTMYTSTKRILNSSPTQPTTRKGKEKEVEAPWVDLKLGLFNGNSAKDVAVTSLMAGGASGAVVCVGSAPFELVKVGPFLSSFPLRFKGDEM
jgi:hypothetical protein